MIELSQSENMLNHIGEYLVDAARTGTEHGVLGNRHPTRAPQGCYPCTGDDAWVVISVGDDQWRPFTEAAGHPEWADDPRFATEADRRANHDALDELIGTWTGPLTPYEVFERCQAHGVPAGPVLHELEALEDPHLLARGLFRPNGNADTGQFLHPSHVWRWDGPDLAWGPLPVMGGDNEAVLKGVAGYTDAEYDQLVADGHIADSYLDADGNPL